MLAAQLLQPWLTCLLLLLPPLPPLQDASSRQQRMGLLCQLVSEAGMEPRLAAALGRGKLLGLLLEEGVRLEAAGSEDEVSGRASLPLPAQPRCPAYAKLPTTSISQLHQLLGCIISCPPHPHSATVSLQGTHAHLHCPPSLLACPLGAG